MFKTFKRVCACLFLFLWILKSIEGKAHGPAENLYEFIENKGQWTKQIRFKAAVPGGNLYLENGSITYNLFDHSQLSKMHDGPAQGKPEIPALKVHVVRINFLSSNQTPEMHGEHPNEVYYNYYIGKDKNKWASSVQSFRKINCDELYPGINLDIYTKDNCLKYDFVIHAGASPQAIKMQYCGATGLCIKDGNLLIKTSLGEIKEKKPYSYQVISGNLLPVPCEFVLKDSILSFAFPKGYDSRYPVVIDPQLIFSTYSGSGADNFGYTATFDSDGFLYAAGTVFDIGYVTTPGAYQQKFMGGDTASTANGIITMGTDIGITKYDTTGTKRIYSTYLGGTGSELPHSLIVNKSDELLIFGTTSSADFPLNNPLQSFKGGPSVFFYGLALFYKKGCDIFISKFDSLGKTLLNSTYLGGSNNDGLNTLAQNATILNQLYPLSYNYADEVRGEIDLDQENNIYLSTCTNSTDFPIVGKSFQTKHGGGLLDACIVKLNPGMDQILWSSFLGGSRSDASYSLALDDSNNVIVTGGTSSTNFPITDSVFQKQNGGGRADGFITKIDKTGSTILKSTYYGYNSYDQSYFVETDAKNNIYVLGQAELSGTNYISNAKYNKANGGQFISKFKPGLDSLVWSTSFGLGKGTPDISPTAFLVDLCSKIYLSGWGGGVNMSDAIAFDQFGNVISTNSMGLMTGLDLTNDAYQKTTDGSDFYLMVLADDASQLVYGSYMGGPVSQEHVDGGTSRFDRKGKIYQSVCAGCGGNSDFPIYPANAVSPTNNSELPQRNCNNAVFKFDFKLPIVVADFKAIGCNPVTLTNRSLSQQHTRYLWDFGDNTTSTEANPIHSYTKAGTYKIILKLFDDYTCNLSDSMVKAITVPTVSLGITATANPVTIMKSQSSQLLVVPATPGYIYSWTPSGTLNNGSIPNPIATPKDTTTYTVIVTDPVTKCQAGASVTVNVIDVFCGEPNIYIPDAFTPNNDGKNEEVFVRSQILEELNFTIYDRWGEKVFETQDQNVGWNGYFRNVKADPGVFVYYLEATCVNNEKFFKKGNITLIR